MAEELRTNKTGKQSEWTKDEILAGLQHFCKINGRYPSSLEIDQYEYLPSSRSIQRRYGGLVTLRSELIPESASSFTRGKIRSAVAKEAYHRAALYEEEFFKFLCTHFDPVAIHEHKIMRPGNIASDFYIYLDENSGIVIDLFYAKDKHSLNGVINIKQKRYSSLPFKVIFVLVGNSNIDIAALRGMLSLRLNSLPYHLTVDTEANFKSSTIFQIKKHSKYSK